EAVGERSEEEDAERTRPDQGERVGQVGRRRAEVPPDVGEDDRDQGATVALEEDGEGEEPENPPVGRLHAAPAIRTVTRCRRTAASCPVAGRAAARSGGRS